MAAQPLVFDMRRPFGPLEDDETCTLGPKTVSFNAKCKGDYFYGVQLSALHMTPEPVIHVLSLKLSGMQREYGWNAIAVHMNKHDGGIDDMFGSTSLPAQLSLLSQFVCPWESSLLTLGIDTADNIVHVCVEPADDGDGGDSSDADEPSYNAKRRRIDYMPYLPTKNDRTSWTDDGTGLKHRSYDANWMDKKNPNIGVSLDSGNRVDIVPVSVRAADSLATRFPDKPLLRYA